MQTLSIGQVTRERFLTILNIRGAFGRISARLARANKSILVLTAEAVLAAFSWALAVFLIMDARGTEWAIGVLASTVGFAVLFRLGASASASLYRASLRHASVLDLVPLTKAVATSETFFAVFVWWQSPRFKVPIVVFLADAAFLMLLWGGLHFGMRVLKAQQAAARRDGKRVVIVGAGDAGLAVLKELVLDPASLRRPVAVVDDDPEKWGRTLCGVPVIGGAVQIEQIAQKYLADEILVCIPSASRAQMRLILDTCRRSNVPVRTLPSLAELIHGSHRQPARESGTVKASWRNLRSPRIEELLQREEIPPDVQETRKVVAGKSVLITGAGGSIGSELCRQIANAGPRMLLLFDKAENSLFYAHLEAAGRLGAARVKPFLMDLLEADRVREILRNERPDIVFHAAAHKHVGLLELQPEEALRNNVLGTRNAAQAALECGVSRFVNISTDKAVNPRNYMGLSKKLAELCVQEMARTRETRFSTVRFGNVAGSTGSVLRLFWEQIQRRETIRVTDPRATRYFMSIPEAVHLILRAAAMGTGGETFVLDMGEPLNIYELAKTMMLFAGLKPGEDLRIEFTGLADGEKIAEQLWEEWERPVPVGSRGILAIRGENVRAQGVLAKVRRMEQLLTCGDRDGLLQFAHEIFPEFCRARNGSGQERRPIPEIAARAAAGAA